MPDTPAALASQHAIAGETGIGYSPTDWYEIALTYAYARMNNILIVPSAADESPGLYLTIRRLHHPASRHSVGPGRENDIFWLRCSIYPVAVWNSGAPVARRHRTIGYPATSKCKRCMPLLMPSAKSGVQLCLGYGLAAAIKGLAIKTSTGTVFNST
jgi:hypothetical protein